MSTAPAKFAITPSDSDTEVQYFLAHSGEVLSLPQLRPGSHLLSSRKNSAEPEKGRIVTLAGRQRGLEITKPDSINIENIEKRYAPLFAWAYGKPDDRSSLGSITDDEASSPPPRNPTNISETAPIRRSRTRVKVVREDATPAVLYEPPPENRKLREFLKAPNKPVVPKLRPQTKHDVRPAAPIKSATSVTPEPRARSDSYERGTVSSRRKGVFPTSCSPLPSLRRVSRLRKEVTQAIRQLRNPVLAQSIAQTAKTKRGLMKVYSCLQAYA